LASRPRGGSCLARGAGDRTGPPPARNVNNPRACLRPGVEWIQYRPAVRFPKGLRTGRKTAPPTPVIGLAIGVNSGGPRRSYRSPVDDRTEAAMHSTSSNVAVRSGDDRAVPSSRSVQKIAGPRTGADPCAST